MTAKPTFKACMTEILSNGGRAKVHAVILPNGKLCEFPHKGYIMAKKTFPNGRVQWVKSAVVMELPFKDGEKVLYKVTKTSATPLKVKPSEWVSSKAVSLDEEDPMIEELKIEL